MHFLKPVLLVPLTCSWYAVLMRVVKPGLDSAGKSLMPGQRALRGGTGSGRSHLLVLLKNSLSLFRISPSLSILWVLIRHDQSREVPSALSEYATVVWKYKAGWAMGRRPSELQGDESIQSPICH